MLTASQRSLTGSTSKVTNVRTDEDFLIVELVDGRVLSVPLASYPRLLGAHQAQRDSREISSGGFGIHWPEIDEDLSTEGLLRGIPAHRELPESRKVS